MEENRLADEVNKTMAETRLMILDDRRPMPESEKNENSAAFAALFSYQVFN